MNRFVITYDSVPLGTSPTSNTRSGVFESQKYKPLIEKYEAEVPHPPLEGASRPPLGRPPTLRMEPAIQQQPLTLSTAVRTQPMRPPNKKPRSFRPRRPRQIKPPAPPITEPPFIASKSLPPEIVGSSSASASLLQNLPPPKEQESNMMLGKGKEPQEKTDLNNYKDIDDNQRGASQANKTGHQLNQNSGTQINASGTILDPLKLLAIERRKERRRQLNRESYWRRKLRKEEELIENDGEETLAGGS